MIIIQFQLILGQATINTLVEVMDLKYPQNLQKNNFVYTSLIMDDFQISQKIWVPMRIYT
jgi:hypothetical protein